MKNIRKDDIIKNCEQLHKNIFQIIKNIDMN